MEQGKFFSTAIGEAATIRAWLDSNVSALPREQLEARRQALALELTDLLLAHLAEGGELRLVSAPPPVRPSALAHPLSRRAPAGTLAAAPPRAANGRAQLAAIVDELADAEESPDEIGGLLAVVRDNERWPALGADAVNAVLVWITARARHLQTLDDDGRVATVLRTMSAYQRDHRAGYVFGLAQTHTPANSTWEAVGEAAWERLLDLLPPEGGPAQECVAPGAPPRKTLPATLPADWAWWGRTRGVRCTLVGLEPREANRLFLEATFGFSTLSWEEATPAALEAVRARLAAGEVGLLVLHDRSVGAVAAQALRHAASEAGASCCSVSTGLGVTGIRRAIEQLPQP